MPTKQPDELRDITVKHFNLLEQGHYLTFTQCRLKLEEELEQRLVMLKAEKERAVREAVETERFMVASAISTQMTPLLVHRLEPYFPTMTAEIIGKVHDKVNSYIDPYLEKHQPKGDTEDE